MLPADSRDEIVVTFSPGRGIAVHRQECGTLTTVNIWEIAGWMFNYKSKPRLIYYSRSKVQVGNKRGILATVAAAISEMGSNIENVAMIGMV